MGRMGANIGQNAAARMLRDQRVGDLLAETLETLKAIKRAAKLIELRGGEVGEVLEPFRKLAGRLNELLGDDGERSILGRVVSLLARDLPDWLDEAEAAQRDNAGAD